MPVLARIGLRNARGHIASRGKTSVLAVIQLEIGHAKSSYLLAIESQITKKKKKSRKEKIKSVCIYSVLVCKISTKGD